MPTTAITVATPDGRCRAWEFRPTTGGPWPAVLFFMDGIGVRPALFTMAERLSAHGFLVLLPDLFYRSGPYEAPDPRTLFSDPENRRKWMEGYVGPAVDASNARSDMRVFLDHLTTLPDVRQPRIGTTGYCMGGGLSLRAAGWFPERVAAAASYHGSRLTTDAPDSPLVLASHMAARVYVGGAIEDAGFTDEMKEKLERALTAAGVTHTIETYAARHGWVPTDTPVHDPAAAERHWTTLFTLLDETRWT